MATNRRLFCLYAKAGVSIELPVAAYREGLSFSHDDIERFAKTLENINRDGEIAQFIGLSQKKLLQEKLEGTSLPGGIASWILMERQVPQVRETVLRLMTENPQMFPRAWFGGHKVMSMALSLMLWHEKEANEDQPQRVVVER